MKKIVGIAAFLLFAFSTSFAQDDIRFGFQLSPTFSWMSASTNTINPSGTNLALKMGMMGEYYFRENYAVTAGLGFVFNSGGTLLHEFGGEYWTRSDLGPALDTLPSNVKLKYSVQYLEIPVGLKMRTREFGYIRYFLEPNLVFGFKTKSTGNIKGTGVGDEQEDLDISKEVNGLNLAWGIGGGIEYSISESTRLIGGIGIQIGFTDATDDNGTVFDPDRGNRTENSKGTINNLIIKLGIMF